MLCNVWKCPLGPSLSHQSEGWILRWLQVMINLRALVKCQSEFFILEIIWFWIMLKTWVTATSPSLKLRIWALLWCNQLEQIETGLFVGNLQLLNWQNIENYSKREKTLESCTILACLRTLNSLNSMDACWTFDQILNLELFVKKKIWHIFQIMYAPFIIGCIKLGWQDTTIKIN